MSIERTYKQISYIKARKEVNLDRLLREEINITDYVKALNSYLKQVRELEIGKELYPNIWLEIIDFKGLLKDELTSVNKLLTQELKTSYRVRVDKNLKIRYVEEK